MAFLQEKPRKEDVKSWRQDAGKVVENFALDFRREKKAQTYANVRFPEYISFGNTDVCKWYVDFFCPKSISPGTAVGHCCFSKNRKCGGKKSI